MKDKIIYGLSNIHYAKNGVIKKFAGGVDLNLDIGKNNITYNLGKSSVNFYGKKENVGALKVVGLTFEEEQSLLYTKGDAVGEIYWGEDDQSIDTDNISLLFEQEKANGGKILTVLYNCEFFENNLTTQTTTNDFVHNERTLEFKIKLDTKSRLNRFAIDTDLIEDKSKVQQFYKKIQYPKGVNIND